MTVRLPKIKLFIISALIMISCSQQTNNQRTEDDSNGKESNLNAKFDRTDEGSFPVQPTKENSEDDPNQMLSENGKGGFRNDDPPPRTMEKCGIKLSPYPNYPGRYWVDRPERFEDCCKKIPGASFKNEVTCKKVCDSLVTGADDQKDVEAICKKFKASLPEKSQKSNLD